MVAVNNSASELGVELDSLSDVSLVQHHLLLYKTFSLDGK
jgi:hypothetical protein